MKFEYGSYGYIAMKDLKAAELNLEMCPHISAQCSHAAVEKMLKHLIVIYKEDSLERREMLKKHKPKVLSRYLAIPDLKKFISQLSDFDSFYYETRYPGEEYYDVTEDQAQEMLDIAEGLCTTVVNLLGRSDSVFELRKTESISSIRSLKFDDLTK